MGKPGRLSDSRSVFGIQRRRTQRAKRSRNRREPARRIARPGSAVCNKEARNGQGPGSLSQLLRTHRSDGHMPSPRARARCAGAKVDIKRVPETVPDDVFKPMRAARASRPRAIAQPAELGQLRRHHLRHRHPLRQHDRPDAHLPRPDRRAVDERGAGGQGRLGVHRPAPRSTAARRARSSAFTPRCCTRA